MSSGAGKRGSYVPPNANGSVNSHSGDLDDKQNSSGLPAFEPIALDYDGRTEPEEILDGEGENQGLIARGAASSASPGLTYRLSVDENDILGSASLRLGMSATKPTTGYSSVDDAAPYSSADSSDGSDNRVPWSEKSWDERMRYIAYYFPIMRWLPEYKFRESFVFDLVAGLTVGAMVIPQSIAYASLVGLSPLQGLGTAFLAKLVYLIFGTNRVLSLGPEATTSILLGHAVSSQPEVQAAVRANNPKLVLELSTEFATVISLMAGILTLAFGLLRLGFVDTVFSRPVLSGFIFGAGVLLITDQTPKLFGAPPCIASNCDETHGKLAHIFKAILKEGDVNWRTILISLFCISFLFGFAYLKKRFSHNKKLQLVPQVFIVVFVVTLVSYLADFKSHGVVTLGPQSRGFPTPQVPKVSANSISNLFASAITLAILGFIETQLVSKVVPSGSLVSPNRELVALGFMHIIVSFFGCYTPFGSLTRTRVSVAAGAKSPITAVIAAIILLFTMTLIIPVFSHMPVCVTGSIIFYVGTTLLETHELKFTFKMRQWMDFALNIVMIIITVFLGVDTALFFAFAACLLLVIKQQNKPSMRLMGRLHAVSAANGESSPGYFEVEESANVHNVELEGILIYQIDGPLFFSNAEGLKDRTRRVEFFGSVQSHPSEPERPLSLKAIIFDLTAVTMVDATAASVLLEIIADYKKRDVRVAFVKLRKQMYERFKLAGLIEAVGGESYLFQSTDQAIETLQLEINSSQINQKNPSQGVSIEIVSPAQPQGKVGH